MRCGDGEVTMSRAYGTARLTAKVSRDAVKYAFRAEAGKYGLRLWALPTAHVIMLPRKPAKLQSAGTRTANGHTWPGRVYQGA